MGLSLSVGYKYRDATIQHLEKEKRNEIVKKLLEFCGNVMQISRVTGISRGVISRLNRAIGV